MIVTRETDYALRILRALEEGRSMTAGELAEEEELPQKFAYKILKKLHKAGYIRIRRGASGGCSLNCRLEEVSLYDLLNALDMNFLLSACMMSGYSCEWCRKKERSCTAHEQLSGIQKVIDAELRKKNLRTILFGAEERQTDEKTDREA
ncbi:MAG: Rrf2 family transcriptional regulator [Clostridium sp.]|nr:Rrf2 family transcriptional regulator [Clostridium sp.]